MQLQEDFDDLALGPQDSEDDFYEDDPPLSASYPPALEYLLSGDYLEDNDVEDGNIKQVRDAEWFLGRKGYHVEELKGDLPDPQLNENQGRDGGSDSEIDDGLSYPLPHEESEDRQKVPARGSYEKKKKTSTSQANAETKSEDYGSPGEASRVQAKSSADGKMST
eukprot:748112-Hanusia_phi.AAC.1